MKNKTRFHRAATLPLTIGTPYGTVTLELEVCRDCGSHFNFRVLETPPLLSTRAAEPFLFRLMHTMEAIGSDLWLNLPPQRVREEIELGIYKNDHVVVPAKSEMN